MTQIVNIPSIEDEIDKAWREWAAGKGNELTTYECEAAFDAGFRAARTVTGTGNVTIAAGGVT